MAIPLTDGNTIEYELSYEEHDFVEGDEFGHIDSTIIDESIISKFSKPSELEKCRECPIYPSCLILNECDGIKDRNSVTCKFDVQIKTRTLEQRYYKFLPNEDMAISDNKDVTEELQTNLTIC